MYALTSYTNLKLFLSQDNDSDESLMRSVIDNASRMIENYTHRLLRGRTYGSNGLDFEQWNGNGTPRYYTRQYPIISVSELYDDTDLTFSSSTLKASTDYTIFKNAGFIQLNPIAVKGTIFTKSLNNIKLIYTAGFDEFNVISDQNNRIDFNEGGSDLVATLTAGVYTASSLASHIKTQMDDAGTDTYTVTYNYEESQFTIASDGSTSLDIKWSTGDNAYRSAARLLGFNISDSSSAFTYTSDFSVLGIPDDLEQACLNLASRIYRWYSQDQLDRESVDMPGGYSGGTKFNNEALPPQVKLMLQPYVRRTT